MKKYEMTYVCERLNVSEENIHQWIMGRLIEPVDPSGPFFDDEDLSRIRLIVEMERLCETHEDALEVILRLVDQVHGLHAELSRLKR
jgi:chaperone modulatory protein CbpM